MNKKTLIFFLLISNTLIKPGTNIYVQNNTPYNFSVKVKETKTHLEKKYWKKGSRNIRPWGKRTKILYTGRDTGVKRKKKYAFHMELKPTNISNGKSVTLKTQLRGKLIGSKIWKAVDGEKWQDGNGLYRRNYFIKNKIKLRVIHKFYEAGTFNDILFVINTVSPKKTEKDVTPKDSKKFTILAYNIYNLNPAVSPGIQERSEMFPERIDKLGKDKKTDFDVLVFSECFDDDGRKEILKRLKSFGYKFSTCILGAGFHEIKAVFDKPIKQPYIVNFNSKKFKTNKKYQQAGEGDPPSGFLKGGILDGGVIIVSKHPITKTREIIYKEYEAGGDKHAKKGAVYAKINKDGKNYHLFGTHTQASYENVTQYSGTRKKQFDSLKRFIDEMNISKNEPVFICGDLNIDGISKAGKKELKEVLKQTNFSLPRKKGHKYSHDNNTNDFLKKGKEKPQLLDYIIFSKKHSQPKKASSEVLIPRTDTPWDKNWKKGHFDLSDHYPVLGQFEF